MTARLRAAAVVAFALGCAACGGAEAKERSVEMTVVRSTTSRTAFSPDTVSRADETALYTITSAARGAGLVGVVRIERVTFIRDGQPRLVAPDRVPAAEIPFERDAAGVFHVARPLPDADRFPFLSTVVIELPRLVVSVPEGKCAAGATWGARYAAGPVSIPGAESFASETSQTSTVVPGDGATVDVETTDTTRAVGSNAGKTSLVRTTVRSGTQRFEPGCSAAWESTDRAESTLVFFDAAGAVVDTLFAVETRTVTSRPSAAR